MTKRKAAKNAPVEPELTVYEPRQGWVVLNLRELWKYRELIYFLSWRDIKIRYRQRVLGAAWVVIQPLVTMLVFTVVFNIILKVNTPQSASRSDSNVWSYMVWSLSGVVIWNYFSASLSRCAGSLVGSASLLTKVYFPRLAIPASAMVTGLVDLLIALIIVVGLMAGLGIAPGWQVVFLPAFVLLALLAALAAGLWLGALNVLYRDVGSMLPFLVQILMFLSPIMYPKEKIPDVLRGVFSLNPVTGAVDGFRWALLGQPFDTQYFWYSLTVVAVMLVGGLFFFKRMERVFADVV
jgi:lipopolysaccharide transport system permease protein